jgi:hypothetical protein
MRGAQSGFGADSMDSPRKAQKAGAYSTTFARFELFVALLDLTSGLLYRGSKK